MDFRKIKGTKHYVFKNREEFEEYFKSEHGAVPELNIDWRTAKQRDWVLADDGGVVQILKQGDLPHPHDRPNWKENNGYVRTVVGSFIQSDKHLMDTDFSKHLDRYRCAR